MDLTKYNILTQEQAIAVRRLTELCCQADGCMTSAETEADPDCVCFFYILEDKPRRDCPAAFLSCMLLKDGEQILPDATFTLHVRPDVRRQGLGRMLYTEMQKECHTLCGTDRISYHTCTGPKGAGYDAAMAMGFRRDISHLLMNLPRPASHKAAKSGDSVTFRPCRNRRILASLYHRIFLVPTRSARIVIDETLDIPGVEAFALFPGGKAAGLAMILCEKDSAYLFNFGIIPEYRRQHLASAMFAGLLPLLPESVRNLQLQVDRENRAALLLYEKLGFRIVTEILELSTFPTE